MALSDYSKKIIETDLLVVGGGTGGAPLAAKAAEQGLDVTIVEKSALERSGNIAHGVDSYGIMPHGISMKELMTLYYNRMTRPNQGGGRLVDENIDYTLFANSLWAVEELDRMGVTMKWDDGEYYWTPHMIHKEGIKAGLRVHWHDVKPKMAKMCDRTGVKTLNRMMLVDILTDNGHVTGATCLDTRTSEFVIIKCKAAVIASGMFCRLYQPETPQKWKYQMRYHYCPASCSGDGWAAAYRAGAGLAHMDDASWSIRIIDDICCSQGNFSNNDGILSKKYYWKGGEASQWHATTFRGNREAEDQGLLPIYQSLEHLPDDWHKRLELNFLDERFISLKLAEDRKFNPRHHWYEMTGAKPLQMMMIQGVFVDENFASPYLKGLYAVGDSAAGVGGAYGACTSGLLVGKNVGNYINTVDTPFIHEDQVKASYDRAMAPLSVVDGTEPMELECSLRWIGERYIGAYRSEGKLLEGIRRFESIKREFLPKLMAKNPHYHMRAVEVQNILQLMELHLYTTLDRRETRANSVRVDYPETDHSRDDHVTINRIEDGEEIFERIPVPALKQEYMEAMN